MKREPIPLLGYALLGLLRGTPLSGYGVRKIFSDSPMGSFSDSPGAIYPALQRLEKAGLVRGQIEDSAGLRRKKVFHLTEHGTAEFKHWLKQPVIRDKVIHGPDELMLRFSFMEDSIGEVATLRFLKSLHKELADFALSLREFHRANHAKLPRSGALALESGVRRYESLRDWCRDAIASYESKERRSS